MSKVAQYKVENAKKIAKLMQEYPIIGIVNMENLPAAQLQRMRHKLRQDVLIIMSKKTFMKHAFEDVKQAKPGIEQLTNSFGGMPALILTKENPFKLASILRKNKSKAPAKPGQLAPFDIVIPAGPTPFAPGPIISELSAVGLKTGVEGGKVAVKVEKTVAKEGEKISDKLASVLSKLGIEPIDIGLDLVAIYDKGTIYGKNVLSVDEAHYLKQLSTAANESLALSLHIAYPAKETIKQLLAKAFNSAKHIAVSKDIISDVVIKKWLGISNAEAEALKAAANISDAAPEAPKEEPKKEAPKEEKPAEAPKEEAKPEPKKEEPEPKKEEKKPADDVEKEIDAQIESMKKKPEEDKSVEKLAEELKKKGTLRDKSG
ncbi:50S ribosomal protein L10 [Candidatus Woesearchaeota archaeon]|nr:50S ribosomal protein L10 [Candidatus Woesearchaeota archaeon]